MMTPPGGIQMFEIYCSTQKPPITEADFEVDHIHLACGNGKRTLEGVTIKYTEKPEKDRFGGWDMELPCPHCGATLMARWVR